MTRISRRTMLRAAGGGAAGLAVPPWWRGAAAHEAATPTVRLGETAWNDLAQRLHGPLLRPGNAMYAPATIINATRYMGVLPAGIAVCTSAQDAATCVTWARDNGVPFAVRSGGHSYAGFSTSDGLVIDVKGMRTVAVDREADSVVVAGGASNADVAAALTPHGVYFPGGRCPTVGLSGLTLGGGWGFSCRHLGMTCDSLLATELVTASGDVVAASEQENPDLFWAVRGAGGGNFGVHTSFTYRVAPTTDVAVCQLSWSGGDTAALAAALLALQQGGPRELGIRVGVGSQSRMPRSQPAPLDVDAIGLYWGPVAELAELLAPLERIQPPDARIVEQTRFASGREFLAHTVPIGTYQIKSGFVQGTLPAAGIATMLEWVGSMPGVPSRAPEDSVALFGFGGKVNDLAPDATAFVHRRDDALFTCSALWEPEDAPEAIAANLEWLDGFYAAMQPYLSGGAYQNFPDRGLPDWQHAYYGENAPRLVEIKRTWDPDNLFRFGQSIPPGGEATQS
jgi:FAD/FMN-containing dehydrogenase